MIIIVKKIKIIKDIKTKKKKKMKWLLHSKFLSNFYLSTDSLKNGYD